MHVYVHIFRWRTISAHWSWSAIAHILYFKKFNFTVENSGVQQEGKLDAQAQED